MAELKLAGPGHGFDVTAEKIVDVMKAGMYDTAAMQKSAVHAAISSAALALTIDVLVHRTEQPNHASIDGPVKRKRL